MTSHKDPHFAAHGADYLFEPNPGDHRVAGQARLGRIGGCEDAASARGVRTEGGQHCPDVKALQNDVFDKSGKALSSDNM